MYNARGFTGRPAAEGRRFRQLAAAVLALLAALVLAQAAQAQVVRNFDPRAAFNMRGDIALVGNVLLTCASSTTCTNIQNGTTTGDNFRDMVYVNVDPAAGFSNSSTANLALPAGSTVRFAGLYWGGRSGGTTAGRSTLHFRTPTAASYQAVTASTLDTINSQGTNTSRPYLAFANVTALVQAAGNGTYRAGGLTAATGNDNLGFYGGWSLVVIYERAADPFRRLMVFDGAATVSGTSSVNVTATGLVTPFSGAFTTRMGALVWEGDQGITGDNFRLNGNNLSDALNPANNFWNSSITRLGTRITAKNPDYVNQLAMDIDYIDASGILANGATSANIEFTTNGDTYFPHALTFAVELYVPDLVTSLNKSAVDLNGGDLLPGDIIEYTISFTNTGQDGATNVVVTDPIPAGTTYVPGSLQILTNATGAPTGAQTDASGDDLAEFQVGPNEVRFRLGQGANATSGGLVPNGQGASFRFRVQLNNDVSLAGQTITNTAQVVHNAQTLGNDFVATGTASASNNVAPIADVRVAKVVDNATPMVGSQVQFTVTVTNDGPSTASAVVLNDALPAGYTLVSATPSTGTWLAPNWTIGNMASGASAQLVILATVNPAGPYLNTATASSSTHDPVPGNNSASAGTTPIPLNPAMTVVKSAPTGSLAVGQTITYTVTATNTGNVTLTDVVVSDPMLTPTSITCPSVAPSGTCVLTGTYVVQQTDIDAGQIVNTGTGSSTQTPPLTSTVTTPIPQTPAMTVVKSAPTGSLAVGQTITYTVTATNTGNVTLTDVVVSDPMLTPNSITCPSVAPGGTCVLTGTYVVQQTDIDAGQIVNTGTGSSTQTPPQTSTVTTPIPQTPAMTVVKSAPTGSLAVGQTITYTVTATNTGNVTLTDVVVSDSMLTPNSITCPSVAPGGTCVLTGTYVVQQTDIDAGQIVNTGTGSSTQTPPQTSTVTTPIPQTPAMTVVKSAPTGSLAVGQTITYTVTATNTGNVTLTDVVVSDPMLTPNSITCPSVAPGGTCVLTGTYVVQQTDIDAGQIVNTGTGSSTQTPPLTSTVTTPIAQTPNLSVLKTGPVGTVAVGETITYTVTATNTGNVTLTDVVVSDPMLTPNSITCPSVAPGGTCVLTGTYVVQQTDIDAGQIVNTGTGSSTQTPPQTSTVTTPIAQTPNLSVLKTGPVGTVAVGETITYTVTATNTGNVTLTNVVVSDPMLTPTSITCPSVAPGGTCVLTGTYVVQQTDIDAGQIVNTGTGSSTQTPPLTSTVTTPIAQTPNLSVLKTGPVGTVAVGETITYTVTATNTGNVTLTNVVVSDPMLTPNSITCPSVAPAGTCVLTGTYVVQQSDVNAGQIVNTGSGEGTSPGNTPVGPITSTVTTPIAQTPALSVLKTGPVGTVAVGETITYTVTATNTGNVTLTNVVVSDPMLTPNSITCASVAPGGTCVLTGTYVVQQSDVNAGQIVNTGSGEGTGPGNTPVGPITSTVTTPIAQTPALSVLKTGPVGTVAVGETITYTVTATNTGNVTLTNVVVSDPMLTPNSITCASVAPAGTCVLTGTYVVQQSDVNAGVIVNTGSAEGTSPIGPVGPVTSTVTTPIAQTPALSVLKTGPVGTVAVGETITYTVTATNTGNVTLTNVIVSDPMLTPNSITCASVAPAGTCVLTGTYVVQQSDVNAGVIVNTGSAEGTSPIGPVGPVNSTVTTPIAQTPALSVLKTGPVGTVAVGETITYTVTATNTGNVTLTNVLVSDPMLTPNSITCASVAPGGTCVLTGTYVVQQSDVNAGQIVNTGSGEGTGPGNTPVGPVTSTITTPIAQTPALSVLKTGPVGTVAVGETITYTVTATNTGNVTLTNVIVSDPMLTPNSTTCPSVAPAGTCVLTGTYVVQQSDVNAGQIVNTGSGEGTGPGNTPVGPITSTVTTPITQTPALSVLKTGPVGTVAVGETITYTVTATNTGNVTLTNVIVSDPMLTPNSITCASVAPAATCVLTGTYVVQQSDVNAGVIVNTGSAEGSSPTGPVGPVTSTVTTPITQTPALSVLKTGPVGTVAVGETITYTVTATNTGNVTLTNVVVSDPMLTPNSITCASVAPAGTCVLTGTYVVQQSDVNAGVIVNTGSAEGTSPIGPVGPVTSTVTTPIAQTPALSVLKTGPVGTVAVGETITYTVTATNTGNVTLTNVIVSDPMLTPNSITCPSVAPGGTCVLTGTYVVQQSDVNAGVIVNTGSAEGTSPIGPVGPVTSTVTTPIAQTPALSVLKTGPVGTVAVGETITYTVTATNTGNVTLTNVVVSDPMLTPNSITCASVAPGGTCVLTGTYVVQQSDVNAGQIVNTGSGEGTGPGNTPVGPITSTVTTPITQTPALSVLKTGPVGTVAVGETITYTVTATNTGNVTLTNVVVSDPMLTPNSITCPSVAPAGTCALTGTYVVQQSDVNAGVIVNTGSAEGTSPIGPVGPVTSTVTTPIAQTPALSVQKTGPVGTVAVGETITYTVTATNTGNVTLTNVIVSDPMLTPNSITCPSVAPGGTCVLTGTYVVQQSDVNAGQIVNTGSGEGTGPANTPVGPITSTVTTPIAQTPALSVLKTGPVGTVAVGETITYTVTATNTGNVTLTNVIVSDPMLTPNSITCASVAPAGTCVLTGTYVVQQSDVNAGVIVNTGSAEGTSPIGPVGPVTSTVTTPIAQSPALSVLKTGPVGTVAVGETITYTVTATNTGNVTLTNVIVSDPMLTPNSITCPSVAPAGTCVLTGTYVVQQSDVNAGVIVNTGSAEGTSPIGPVGPVTSTVTTPIAQTPALSVLKTGPVGTVAVGETITYTVTATNTGNVTLTNVIVSDPMLTPNSITCPSVAPAGTCVLTGTYVVQQSDVNAGVIVNTGSAEGTSPIGPVGPVTSTVTTPIAQTPALSVLKTGPVGTVAVGETITYTVTATNTGNVTLTNVIVSDPMLTPNSITCPSVAPAGTCVLTGTYVVQQSDVNAGVIVNTGSAEGISPTGPVGPVTSTVTTPIAQSPALSVLKTGPVGTVAVGETITYTVTATNTGNVTLTNVIVSDPMLTPNSITCPSVAPAGTCVLTGTYVVQQSDVNAGQIVNTGSAEGTSPTGPVGPVTSTVTTPIAQTPNLSVLKTGPVGTVAVGETITYTVTATNTGNVTLTNVIVSDPMLTPNSITCPSVAPAGTCVLTGTYVVQQSDVNAGQIVNTGSAEGTSPTGPVGPVTSTVTTPIQQKPALAIVKSQPTGSPTLGQTLTYVITATNNGNVTLTNVVVNDPMLTPNSITCASVAPAGTCVLTGTYVVQQTDVNAGQIVNTASAEGRDPGNALVGPVTDTVTTPVPQAQVTLSKSVSDASGDGLAQPGELLTYTITLANSSVQPATGVAVTDVLDVNTSFVSADNGGNHAGGVVTWSGLTVPGNGALVLTVLATVNDPIPANVGTITNLAHETGLPPPDCSVVPQPAGCATLPTAPALSVSKAVTGESIIPDGIAQPGEVLTYTITVRNEGGAAALNTLINEWVPQHTTFVGGTPTWTCAAGSVGGTPCDTLVDVPAAAGGSPGVVTATFQVQVVDPIPAGVLRIANVVALNDRPPVDCQSQPTLPQCAVVPTISVDLVKSVQSVATTGPNMYLVRYLIEVRNLGGSPAVYTLTDTLDHTANGLVYTGNARVETSSGQVNPSLPGGQFAPANGSTVQVSAANVTIASGAVHAYTLTVPVAVLAGGVQNGQCTGQPGNGLFNRANITGTFAVESAACAPISANGTAITLVKTVEIGIDNNGNGYGDVGDVLFYDFVVSNTGNTNLTAISLLDPRVTDLACSPLTAFGHPITVLRGDELFRDRFEPFGLGDLVPGDSLNCAASYVLTAQDVAERRVVNTATASGSGPGGQVVSSTSTAVFTGFR